MVDKDTWNSAQLQCPHLANVCGELWELWALAPPAQGCAALTAQGSSLNYPTDFPVETLAQRWVLLWKGDKADIPIWDVKCWCRSWKRSGTP